MRLDTLTIKGVLAFPREVTIDFKDLPPGLIALVGPNGHGKTTVMEAPAGAIFRKFPSRDKKIFDYALGPDAFLQTTFEVEGRGMFRARLNLDAPHRKQEATLSRLEADGTSVFLNDRQLLSSYDEAVARILPPLRDLLASVIAAQTKVGSFSELDTRDRRVLFGSLLGLDHLEELAERARLAADRTEQEIIKVAALRDALTRATGTDEEAAIEGRAQQLQIESGTVESRRAEVRRLITDAESALSSLQEASATHASARERFDRREAERLARMTERDEALGRIAALQRELVSETSRLAKGLAAWLDRNAAAQHDESGLAAEIATLTTARDAAVAEATKRIDANKDLQARGPAIRAAAEQLTLIDACLTKNAAGLTTQRQRLEQFQQRERVQLDALFVIDGKAAELARAERDAARLTVAPFKDACAPCEFMVDAVAAQAQIPGLREAVASRDTALEELANVRSHLAGARDSIAALEAAEKRMWSERIPVATEAADLPHLTAAEERIKTRQQQIVDAETRYVADLAEARRRHVARVERLVREAEDRKTEHAGELVVLEERVCKQITVLTTKAEVLATMVSEATADRDRAAEDAKATKDAARQASEAESRLATYRAEWDDTTATLARVRSQAEELARRAEQFRKAKAEFTAADQRLQALRTDLVEWRVLAKALGREGLQTIEIDNAGPTVSAFFNDLAQGCGFPFVFELVTQAPKASKGKDGSTLKEVFDANLYDQRRGGEKRDIADLSGGERVLAEEILRSAIALLVNTRNQMPMRTCWRDETTGALDPENAERYIAMLRRVQAIGGFHQILFVTHNLDCARLADAQLRIENGDYTIALPPYAEALVEA